jgi:hypothetical protein
MIPKYVAPSISAHSFSCPHCGTLAHQTWFFLFAASFDKDKLPMVSVSPQQIIAIQSNRDKTKIAEMMQYIRMLSDGELFIAPENESRYSNTVRNCHLSQCYSCNKYALWLHDNLLYPAPHLHVECNSDMPDEIRADFNEAREIFFSRRAARQRFCVWPCKSSAQYSGSQAKISMMILPAL